LDDSLSSISMLDSFATSSKTATTRHLHHLHQHTCQPIFSTSRRRTTTCHS
jgi:hypothetical protein